MFTFSVNKYGGAPTKAMVGILSKSNAHDTASIYQEGIGEIYLRMNSPAYRNKPDANISIQGYVRKTKIFGDYQQSQREVPLITDEEFEEDGVKGVTESVASYICGNMTDMLDGLAYQEAMEQYQFYAEKLELECDLVLSDVLLRAKDGCMQCIRKLAELVKQDRDFAEFLQDFIAKGYCNVDFFSQSAY